MTGLNLDRGLVGHGRILAWQRVKLPRYGREGAVEVRPFPAEKTPCISIAQGLLGEAVNGNPTTGSPRSRCPEANPSNRVNRTSDKMVSKRDADESPCRCEAARSPRG